MDFSQSMQDDLDELKSLANSLAIAIRNASENFRLGYGSFVDKPYEPFIMEQGRNVALPCESTGVCKKPYGYEHALSLSSDSTAFARTIRDEKISGNFDSPEGGFDGLYQAAVCKQVIGWRDEARKVVVMATDNVFHSAGDGRLIGAVRPPDGRCYLEQRPNGRYRYTEDINWDFPSVSHLRTTLIENEILPIFAIAGRAQQAYDHLLPALTGSGAVVVNLTSDSDNIIKLLSAELARLVAQVRVEVLTPAGISVGQIQATCPNGEPPVIDPQTNIPGCDNMAEGLTAKFEMTLSADSCETLRNVQTVKIQVLGFGEVTVDITPQCTCPCESTPVNNSQWCSAQGTEACGLCSCNAGFVDRVANLTRCDCNTTDTSRCLAPSSNSRQVCSGKGACSCGSCVCDTPELVSGTYCECDKRLCPVDLSGRRCGGEPENGTCDCGACRCRNGLTGPACNCTTDTSTCRAAGDENRLCNDEGDCVCGQCVCRPGFAGQHCTNCGLSQGCAQIDICARSLPCVTCQEDSDDPLCAKCGGPVVMIDPPPVLPRKIQNVHTTRCRYPNGSCFNYYYVAVNRSTGLFFPIEIERILTCSKKDDFNYLPLVLGIIFGLLVSGLLLLLLWRLLVHYKDLQEYKRFVKAQSKQDWSKLQNPFYKQPTQKFENPQYEGERM